jgi:hypothetical protein
MSVFIPEDAYFIIIGAMRSGTTSLYMHLKTHPQICPAFVKEPAYFTDRRGDQMGLNIKDYKDLWNFDPCKHNYVMEASTNYTLYPHENNVPKNMFEYGINPKLVYILRDPFDRIESQYNFLRYRKWFKFNIDHDRLVLPSDYYLQLTQYQEYFNKDNILLLDFNELKNDPFNLLKKIYSFLKIKEVNFNNDHMPKNPTPSISILENNINNNFNHMINKLPKPIKRVGKYIIRSVMVPPQKRELTRDERVRIHNRLKLNMMKLYRIFGFDVRTWGFTI